MRIFLRRQAVLPFEALIAFLAVVSGGLALLKVGGIGADALSVQLPGWLATTAQALYFVAGLAMWVGIGLGRRDVESFGLVMLAGGVIVRSVGLFAFVGFDALVAVAYLFNAAVVLTCAVRLRSLVKGQATVQAERLINGENE